MLDFAEKFATTLKAPAIIELVGDVGVGKTTFTRGLAKGLGVSETVTSPSFTISKRYAFPGGNLIHYDFYRLEDPGLMAEDLADSLSEQNSIIVIEWGDSISDLLPDNCQKVSIRLTHDGKREVIL